MMEFKQSWSALSVVVKQQVGAAQERHREGRVNLAQEFDLPARSNSLKEVQGHDGKMDPRMAGWH